MATETGGERGEKSRVCVTAASRRCCPKRAHGDATAPSAPSLPGVIVGATQTCPQPLSQHLSDASQSASIWHSVKQFAERSRVIAGHAPAFVCRARSNMHDEPACACARDRAHASSVSARSVSALRLYPLAKRRISRPDFTLRTDRMYEAYVWSKPCVRCIWLVKHWCRGLEASFSVHHTNRLQSSQLAFVACTTYLVCRPP